MFSRPRATAPESCLHFTQACGARHALAALLAAEAPYRVPAAEVLGPDDDGDDDQDNNENAGQGDRS